MIPETLDPTLKGNTSKFTYEIYTSRGGTLSYKDYYKVLETFNERAMERVIYEGERLEMGCNLSGIQVVRSKRKYNHPRVHWPLSRKNKEKIVREGKTPKDKKNPDGVEWFVYMDGSHYCWFYWNKKNVKIVGKSIYRFTPTRGKRGHKGKLWRFAVEGDELNQTIYDDL